MTREETNAAIRRSLLMGESRAERHGVYARRTPPPIAPPLLPWGQMEDPTGFAPGCLIDWVPPVAP